MNKVIRISSEQEALSFLTSDGLSNDVGALDRVEFVDWPVLNVRFSGDAFNSSLQVKQLRAFVKLQESIYFQYAESKNIEKSKLSRKERELLEVNFSIRPGSSEINVDLARIVESMSQSDPLNVSVIGAVLLALIYGGHSCFYAYMEYKSKKIEYKNKKIENKSAEVEMILNLLSENSKLSKRLDSAMHAMQSIALSAPRADYVEINNKQVKKIKKTEKNKKIKKEDKGEYKKGRFYEEECEVVTLSKAIDGVYEFAFQGKNNFQLIWRPRSKEISAKLNHEISMSYNKKNKIYLGFDVVKRQGRSKYLIIVRSIFRAHNKPRSYL